MSAHVLEWRVFTTSRLAEFCSQKELVAQTGHPVEQWPLVVLKELIDNSLDACEEADIAPVIHVAVNAVTGVITISDNGPGISPETVKRLLDYNVRVSSREAYVSPTRGAQGNADGARSLRRVRTGSRCRDRRRGRARPPRLRQKAVRRRACCRGRSAHR